VTQLESRELAAELIQAIGGLVLQNDEYRSDPWDGLSIVVTLVPGRQNVTGYIYDGDSWTSRTPRGDDSFLDKCIELQEAMRSPKGEVWKQALIHITKPGPEINIKFEYDDPKRWSLKKVSLDMSDYAESLRPPRKDAAVE